MSQIILYGLVGSLISLLGGILLLWRADFAKKITNILLAFGAGTFIGIALLDILPEAVEMTPEPDNIFLAAAIGFAAFFAFERYFMKHMKLGASKHNHSEHVESLPWMLVAGDTGHNFLDGVVIALAYIANPLLGLPTAIAIALHEIPQEIADFAILLDRGWSRVKVIAVNILSALATFVGIAVAYLALPFLESSLPILLGLIAGVFIYIAASQLVPEIHHRAGHEHANRILLAFVIGIILIWYLISLTH